MKRFVAGADRAQSTLLPESLDDCDPVRAIDAFVDASNVGELGFERQAGGDGAFSSTAAVPSDSCHARCGAESAARLSISKNRWTV